MGGKPRPKRLKRLDPGVRYSVAGVLQDLIVLVDSVFRGHHEEKRFAFVCETLDHLDAALRDMDSEVEFLTNLLMSFAKVRTWCPSPQEREFSTKQIAVFKKILAQVEERHNESA
jgi:hypothetical protein